MKRQELSVTRASKIVALAYAVIDVIESIYDEEVPLEEVLVSEFTLDPPPGSVVEVNSYYPGRSGALGERRIEALKVKVRVIAGESRAEHYPFTSLYRLVALAPLRGDRELIRRLARETAETGVEHMILYTDSGYAAILEGEHYMVRIPFVKAAAAYHTHPEGACEFSWKDLESSLDLMVEGGVGEGAVTVDCAVVAYRVGFPREEDYIALRESVVKRRPVDPRVLKGVRIERVTY